MTEPDLFARGVARHERATATGRSAARLPGECKDCGGRAAARTTIWGLFDGRGELETASADAGALVRA